MTTLNCLREYDRETAGKILTVVALSRQPDPGIEGAANSDLELNEEHRRVLQEIYDKTRTRIDDPSPKAHAVVDEFIARLLSSYLVLDHAGAIERAGNAGRLSPAMYDVVLPKSFIDRFSKLGVDRSAARDAIRNPDEYQHLSTDVVGNSKNFSLFLKIRGTTNSRYWLMLVAQRDGAKMVALHGWRIYPEIADTSEAKEPLDLLRVFCEKFGFNVTVLGETKKFIYRTLIPDVEHFQIRVDHNAGGERLDTFSIYANAMDQRTTVGLVYSIDIPKYQEYLKRHGA